MSSPPVSPSKSKFLQSHVISCYPSYGTETPADMEECQYHRSSAQRQMRPKRPRCSRAGHPPTNVWHSLARTVPCHYWCIWSWKDHLVELPLWKRHLTKSHQKGRGLPEQQAKKRNCLVLCLFSLRPTGRHSLPDNDCQGVP